MYNYNVNPIDIRPFMQGMEMSRQRDKEQQLQDLRQRVASGDQSAFKEYSMVDPQGAAAFQALNKPEVPELNAADINEFYKDAKSLYPLLEKDDPRAVVALENMKVKYSGTPFVQAVDGFIKNYQVNPDATLQDYRNFLSAMPPIDDGGSDEFRKETRADIRKGVSDIRKRSTEIVGSYNKIESLLKKDKLTRIDVSSAITSMARLISPGIVTDKDFQSLSNSGAPVQEIIAQLRGFGAEGESLADALNRSLDPTNPNLFDKNAFMDTASRVITSEVPTLLGNYSDLQGMAKRAGVSKTAYDTFFGGNQKMIEKLTKLQNIQPTQSKPDSAPRFSKLLGREVTMQEIEQTAKNRGITAQEVINQLQLGG